MNEDVARYYEAMRRYDDIGDPAKIEYLREYYDTHDVSSEMEDGEWVFPVTPDHFFEGVRGLPDGFDDPRINAVCSVLEGIYKILKHPNATINLRDLRAILDDQVGEFYDKDYWEYRG